MTSLLGCVGRTTPGGEVAVSETDSAGVLVVTVSGEPSALPEVRLSGAPLAVISGDAAPFLGEVGEVRFRSDGSLLVEDNQAAELRIFDDVGGMLRLVGGPGDGPGEFRNITNLSIGAGDTTYAYDRRLSRISVFDRAGELITTVAVGREFAGRGTIALGAWAFDSDNLVLHSMGRVDSSLVAAGPRLAQRTALLHSLDATGQAGSQPLQFTGGLSTVGQTFDGTSPLGNETIVAVGANRLVFGAGVDYELTVMTRDWEPQRIIRWSGWMRPLEASIVQAARDSMAARLEAVGRASSERITALLDAIFAPELVPPSLPVMGDVLIDDQARMWVSEFRPRTQEWAQEDAWHVLDASGRPIARLSLPSRTRLGAVGDDRVALVTRDALDGQHIQVFGITFEAAR